MKIVPELSSYLAGVEIPTSSPIQKKIFLLSPRINKRGDGLRSALKKLDEHEREVGADYSKVSDEEKASAREKRRKLELEAVTESIKQQYKLQPENKAEESVVVSEEHWIEAVSDLFTEDDLFIAVYAIRAGIYMSREKIYELALKKI